MDTMSMDSFDSFQLLPQLELIFELPGGIIFEKTFAEMPDYATLWKTVRTRLSSPHPFEIYMDGERMRNGNTVPKLRSVVEVVLASTSEKRKVGICLQVCFSEGAPPNSSPVPAEKDRGLGCSASTAAASTGGANASTLFLPKDNESMASTEDMERLASKFRTLGMTKAAAGSVEKQPRQDWLSFEARCALFSKVTKEYLLFPHQCVLKYQGQPEGDEGYLYFLLEGTCREYVNGVATSLFRAGDVFGEFGLIARQPAGSTIIVENSAKCYRIQYQALRSSEFYSDFEDLCTWTMESKTQSPVPVSSVWTVNMPPGISTGVPSLPNADLFFARQHVQQVQQTNQVSQARYIGLMRRLSPVIVTRVRPEAARGGHAARSLSPVKPSRPF